MQLLDQMFRFCDTEAFGTEHLEECISPANKESADLLDGHTIKLELGYEAPVLWRDGVRPLLPENRALADARLQSLIDKFRRSRLIICPTLVYQKVPEARNYGWCTMQPRGIKGGASMITSRAVRHYRIYSLQS